MQNQVISEAEQKIMAWEYPLRQLIYAATRYTFSSNNDGRRSLIVMFKSVDGARQLFEIFKIGLKSQLTETENWKAIGIDLNSRFLKGIRGYYEWYNTNEEYRAFFGENSPYDLILNVAQSTEDEICKYFPEYESSKTDLGNNITQSQNAQPAPTVFIIPEARQFLYDCLKTYVEEKDRLALFTLIIDSKAPDEKINHHCQQNVLAYFFRQLSEAKFGYEKVVGTQTNISSWICANFNPATYDTIYDVVRGNKSPSKNKRIPINA